MPPIDTPRHGRVAMLLHWGIGLALLGQIVFGFFGVRLAPWGPDLPAVYGFFNGLHVVLAWVLTLLVVGHVAVALHHALVRRDGVFQRMWPRPSRPSRQVDFHALVGELDPVGRELPPRRA